MPLPNGNEGSGAMPRYRPAPPTGESDAASGGTLDLAQARTHNAVNEITRITGGPWICLRALLALRGSLRQFSAALGIRSRRGSQGVLPYLRGSACICGSPDRARSRRATRMNLARPLAATEQAQPRRPRRARRKEGDKGRARSSGGAGSRTGATRHDLPEAQQANRRAPPPWAAPHRFQNRCHPPGTLAPPSGAAAAYWFRCTTLAGGKPLK